jgi:hypothetical protein
VQVFEDFFDKLFILDKCYYFHRSQTVRTLQGIDTVDFLNQAGPILKDSASGRGNNMKMRQMTIAKTTSIAKLWTGYIF